MIMFLDKACAVSCTWKACLLMKWQFKNKKYMRDLLKHHSHFR